jgi:hypothetical protein
MKRRTAVWAAALLGLAAGLVALGATPALAHEERTVGPYHFAVGFGDEPAYAGQENSVQLFLHEASDKPVLDLGDTLKVEVAYGGQTMPPMTMQPNFEVGEFGVPGDYRAFFFPTRAGSYTFHFTGSIKGRAIDQSFSSGPSTFSDVVDPSSVEFPAKDPTAGELSARIDREVTRLDVALGQGTKSAKDSADQARTVAFVGIGLGVLGLAVAALALSSARRRTG